MLFNHVVQILIPIIGLFIVGFQFENFFSFYGTSFEWKKEIGEKKIYDHIKYYFFAILFSEIYPYIFGFQRQNRIGNLIE